MRNHRRVLKTVAVAMCVQAVGASGAIDILHSFQGGDDDGRSPHASTLTRVGSKLYGVTENGGSSSGSGYGVVFEMDTDGSNYRHVHEFGDFADGAMPTGTLAVSGDVLYGTTRLGGDHSGGTVFKVNTDGTGFESLYDFDWSVGEGYRPKGGIALDGGTLYGATSEGGGTDMDGTLYKVNTDGTGFQTLHSFEYRGGGGWAPSGRPIVDSTNQKLYGVTGTGGTGGGGTYGVLYSIETDGSNYSLVHDFAHAADGSSPSGALLLDGTTLYGTTLGGGDGGVQGEGLVYSVETDGSDFQVLHNFPWSTSDGKWPNAGLALSGTTLAGMTPSGGTHDYGVLYTIDLSTSTQTVEHNFRADRANNGCAPQGALTVGAEGFYGMTEDGGSSHNRYGAVFAISGLLTRAALTEGSATVSYDEGGVSDGGFGVSGLPGGTLQDSVDVDGLTLGAGGYATLCVDYSPEELAACGIIEDTLRLYWYDEDAATWHLAGRNSNLDQSTGADLGDSTPSTVLGDWGIDTEDNYVWANIDHASTYGMGGTTTGVPEPAGLLLCAMTFLAALAGFNRRRTRT